MLAAHDTATRNGLVPALTARAAPASRFAVLVERREDDIARRLAGVRNAAATAFQNEGWLRA